jgi:DNA-binding MarR family transcriptional regulator
MPVDPEHRLLEILSRRQDASQRKVAREAGLSLGMVNLVLRRLAKTGYIKVSALNGQTMRYVLTTKGSAELARRSYEYLLRVIESFGELRTGITALVHDSYAQGHRGFLIYGDGDVADLAELACRSSGLEGIEVLRQQSGALSASPGFVVLDCRVNPAPHQRLGIHVLEHLARSNGHG